MVAVTLSATITRVREYSMKKSLAVVLIFFIVLISVGCGSRTYTFKKPIDEIESIEIVSAESCLRFTVIKSLSETEKLEVL